MINLENLVTIHDNKKTIRRHRKILEELFYLCINESFEKTIMEARTEILGMMPDIGINLPIQNIETATDLRNEHLIRNDNYQSLLVSIGEKHNYHHPSFIRNYGRVGGDAYRRLNIIENILFFNNPIPENNPVDHFKNRSGYMEIAHDEIEGPYIRIHFDLGTSIQEIKDIIDKDFPETKELQAEHLNISKKQYRVDPGLRKKLAIHERATNGDSDMSICLYLGRNGLADDVEYTADFVRLQRGRIQKETLRYSSDN